MKRLSKAEAKAHGEFATELGDAVTALNEGIDKYNELVGSAWEEFEARRADLWAEHVSDQLADVNDAVSHAAEFRDQVVSQMDEYYDDRSERWQEGEAGEQYMSWKEAWEAVDFEPASELGDEAPDLDRPDEVDHFDIDPDEFGNLTSNPNESW